MRMLRENGELSIPVMAATYKHKPGAILLLIIFACSVSIGCIYYQLLIPFFILCGVLLVLFLLNDSPRFGLYATLLILPISWTIALDQPLLGISGLKLPVILPLLSFLYLLLVCRARSIEYQDGIFIFLGIVLFTIAVIRAYPYCEDYAIAHGETLSVVKHIMSSYLRQLLIYLLILFIPVYIKSEKDIKRCIQVILCSVVLGFITVLLVMATSKSLTFEDLREQMQMLTGIHPGYFANYFLLALPVTLLLGVLMKWRVCYILLGIEVFSIAVTFSRAAYLTAILSIFLVLLLLKMWRTIFCIVLISPVIYMMIPNIVIDRLMTGIAEKNINVVAAGRIDAIWQPLLQELSEDTSFLLFGNGRYGVFGTTVYKSGAALSVNNAHNIVLDAICDGGIILALFFLIFFIHYLHKFYRISRRTKNPLEKSILLGTCIGVSAFIIKGMTDGVFWAESSNALVYVMLGLSLAVTYLNKEKIISIVGGYKYD